MKILFSFIFSCSVLASACVTINMPGGNTGPTPTPARTPKPATPATVNGSTISADMADEGILKAFGMDIRSAQAKTAKGPDGHSTSYSSGEQTVSITRSVVSGVYVYADGPINGEWRLGGGL